MSKPLLVYKASAGSGKTFTLAIEYIKLLINNPQCYRTILAVTFTNKATAEMKMRILSQLYGISKHLESSKDYCERVALDLDMSEEVVAERAGKALSYLLHNYNYFKVQTIDTFFQTVLRNMARELDLTANLRIELNDYQIEQQAVDELINSLESSNEVLGWIMNFIQEKLSDDSSWNVIAIIKDFGKNIFKDIYKSNSKKLNEVLLQKNFFNNYTQRLRKLRNNSINEITGCIKPFFEVINDNGLNEDNFSYKMKGVYGYFVKIQNGTYTDDINNSYVQKAMDDPAQWLTKKDKDPNSELYKLIDCKLMKMLHNTETIRKKNMRLINSVELTLKNINQLRLLSKIESKVREMNEESNRFLLSDTQMLLHSLIKDSDSPFIFEKIGTQLEHIMIDEFQDTSTVQWQNFKVLLQECMSHEDTENLIVGDVKQSIYRWRSGDWHLLNNITDEFKTNQNSLEVKQLDTNYRSERRVIEFNNKFFESIADIEYENLKKDNPVEAEQVKLAYKDIAQKIPSSKGNNGFVHIELLPTEDYNDKMLSSIKEAISTLLNKNVRPKDIAILVRNNIKIQHIADYFMQEMPEVKLVSDEAFRLDASQAVNIIIDALQYLVHPDDKIALANLIKGYQANILHNKQDINGLLSNESSLLKLLPKDFIDNRQELLAMPLYELSEQIFELFSLKELSSQSAYVCTFYDKLSSYLEDMTTDIDSFIKLWNENLHEKTIQSDEIDGIRLMTIHKSKGLEYDNIILPYCDWTIENNDSQIWCIPEEEPFKQMPLVPINLQTKLIRNSIYDKDYIHEHLQNSVDNLNLLYVAFTRARKNLFVFGKRKTRENIRSYNIEKTLSNFDKILLNSTLSGIESDPKDESIILEYGELYTKTKEEQKSSSNVFVIDKTYDEEILKIETFKNNTEFRQSNKSRDFIEEDDEDNNQQKQYINMGNILHQLFSRIRTYNDVDKILRELENDGVIYDEIIDKEKLIYMLRERLKTPIVKSWFSDKWKLFNECTILSRDEVSDEVKENRPDRVMTDGNEMIVVDFKFGHPRNEYIEQVQRYMYLLSTMGYKNIKGYLWFVYSNKIVEVK